MTRREALQRCGAALAAVAVSGCAPTFLARALYPEADALDSATIDRALVAFISTVIPGAENPVAIVRLFADPALRIAPYRAVLVADLTRRARALHARDFEHLTEAQRTQVVRDGLEGGAVAGKLYTGAVFLAQVVFFSGLWHPRGECPLIGFEGAYRYQGPEALTYPDPENFLAAAITADGNPA